MANVEDIEGVGPAYAAKLEAAGVKTIDGLLSTGGTKKGRVELAEKSGVAEANILRWVNHCDLMRIKGVGPQFSELLEKAGVDSVPELAQRNAANLAKKMDEVNADSNISGRSPSEEEVSDWVEAAKSMDRAVHH